MSRFNRAVLTIGIVIMVGNAFLAIRLPGWRSTLRELRPVLLGVAALCFGLALGMRLFSRGRPQSK